MIDIKQNQFFPQIYYFDLDFITLYEQTWSCIESKWVPIPNKDDYSELYGYLDDPDSNSVELLDIISSSFFLLYSNSTFSATHALDYFYENQEKNGFIPTSYSKAKQKPNTNTDKKGKVIPPLLIWAEFIHYNRTDTKKRLKTILPKLDSYLEWFINTYQTENGLFAIPTDRHYINNKPHKGTAYFVDFNAQMAHAFFLMMKLTTYTNLRNLLFKYTKLYYSLKALINKHFWCAKDNFYYDLNKSLSPVPVKTLSCFWTLLANIPNNNQVTELVKHLRDPESFYTPNVFPTVAQNESTYAEGMEYRGSIYPLLTYMVIKGLTDYGYHEFAREATIKHLSSILAVFFSQDKSLQGTVWESYQPNHFEPAMITGTHNRVRQNHFPTIGISNIALVIENILGFDICLPKKTVYWNIPHLEHMGIESFKLKRNQISTVLQSHQEIGKYDTVPKNFITFR